MKNYGSRTPISKVVPSLCIQVRYRPSRITGTFLSRLPPTTTLVFRLILEPVCLVQRLLGSVPRLLNSVQLNDSSLSFINPSFLP